VVLAGKGQDAVLRQQYLNAFDTADRDHVTIMPVVRPSFSSLGPKTRHPLPAGTRYSQNSSRRPGGSWRPCNWTVNGAAAGPAAPPAPRPLVRSVRSETNVALAVPRPARRGLLTPTRHSSAGALDTTAPSIAVATTRK
jgi:hypothetical protein